MDGSNTMFDIVKFGKALSTLRKNADMTQNEVADKLNLSRQAISKYERGESFPDISVLVTIAELFDLTLDQLIGYGEPTKGESAIIKNVAKGNADVLAENIADIKMITTPSSIKYEKFGKIENWLTLIDSDFGVVKYDKETQ